MGTWGGSGGGGGENYDQDIVPEKNSIKKRNDGIIGRKKNCPFPKDCDNKHLKSMVRRHG